MQNEQTEQNKASYLPLLAIKCTKVRRVARFVRSIKYNFFINFRFSIFLRGSIGLLNLQNPLIYIVLCYLRFSLFDKSAYKGVARPKPPDTVNICPVV